MHGPPTTTWRTCVRRPRTGPPALVWDAPWVQIWVEPWRAWCRGSTLRRAMELVDVADLAFHERIQTALEPAARHDLQGAQLRTVRALVDALP